MKTLVAVPAYNEESNVSQVVNSIKSCHPGVDIIVINDGSVDNTGTKAKSAGARVLELSQNLGIGGAVQTGYLFAARNNYDVMVQIDGDGQHNPACLSKLLKELETDSADIVIGSRFLADTEYKSSIPRKIGIRFLASLVSIICRKSYFDTTSGFRAVNRKGIELFSEYYPKDYPEVESIVYASKRGLRIKEITVHMETRKGGKSSITPLKSVYYILKVTAMLLLQPKEVKS